MKANNLGFKRSKFQKIRLITAAQKFDKMFVDSSCTSSPIEKKYGQKSVYFENN